MAANNLILRTKRPPASLVPWRVALIKFSYIPETKRKELIPEVEYMRYIFHFSKKLTKHHELSVLFQHDLHSNPVTSKITG